MPGWSDRNLPGHLCPVRCSPPPGCHFCQGRDAAVPVYWILGRSRFNGYVTARRLGDVKVAEVARGYVKTLTERKLIGQPDRDRAFLVEKLAKLPFTTGNGAELLVDGDATFQSIFEGISKAEKYVLVQFYIIQDDVVGRELKTRLLERAKAGVRCYLLYDEIGTRLPRAYTDELKHAGIQVFPFNTRQGEANRFQINFRNHRKIVISDGREAWVGGLNVGREYRGLDRILIPEKADNPLAQYSAWSYLEALQKAGIKVYRYTRGFLHHKVVVVDDDYCTVGTANFDNRSFRLNFEITMAFADRDLTRQVTAMLENDFSNARLVRAGKLQEHGFGFRLAVQAARLTAPVQ